MKEETREWLDKAESDFEDAAFNVENDKRVPGAFFLHQSVEKALKAFQLENSGEYSFSHDLLELASEEARNKHLELLKDLNPVYTGVRYPDIDLGNIENLDELKEDVEEFLEWIRTQLEK